MSAAAPQVDLLEAFLAKTEQQAFQRAQLATRDTAQALDVVRKAMRRFVREGAAQTPAQWSPLFQQILLQCIGDWRRGQRLKRLWFWNSSRARTHGATRTRTLPEQDIRSRLAAMRAEALNSTSTPRRKWHLPGGADSMAALIVLAVLVVMPQRDGGADQDWRRLTLVMEELNPNLDAQQREQLRMRYEQLRSLPPEERARFRQHLRKLHGEPGGIASACPGDIDQQLNCLGLPPAP
ncbi:MAG: hypothetical protein LBE59_12625 [Nevskiaceae bacterium]|nr:hypothetical protein [Nevskiaceae bacterium]